MIEHVLSFLLNGLFRIENSKNKHLNEKSEVVVNLNHSYFALPSVLFYQHLRSILFFSRSFLN